MNLDFVIQTNTFIDDKGNPRDFQSMVFAYYDWNAYKSALLYEESSGKIVMGTMYGCIKPRGSKIEQIIINDDHHLECLITNDVVTINVKSYKINGKELKNIVNGLV